MFETGLKFIFNTAEKTHKNTYALSPSSIQSAAILESRSMQPIVRTINNVCANGCCKFAQLERTRDVRGNELPLFDPYNEGALLQLRQVQVHNTKLPQHTVQIYANYLTNTRTILKSLTVFNTKRKLFIDSWTLILCSTEFWESQCPSNYFIPGKTPLHHCVMNPNVRASIPKMSLHLPANTTVFLGPNVVHNTSSWRSPTPIGLHWNPCGVLNIIIIEYFEALPTFILSSTLCFLGSKQTLLSCL